VSALLDRVTTKLARHLPGPVWRSYGKKAAAIGLDRLYLVLSCDCDTPEDAEAAARLHDWLTPRGMKATYAVPGATLAEAAGVYQRLSREGAAFINHGALPHAAWRDRRYWSITFYHEMSAADVVRDVENGDRILRDVIGCTPTGFRAPHFGLYQSAAQLRTLHGVLVRLGYRFSTSTVPSFAIRNGPVVRVNGLVEVPVSGSWESPLVVLDSWGRIVSPEQPEIRDSYAAALIETVDRLQAMGVCGVLNYYVDPAHVHRSPAFFKALEHVASAGIPSLHYDELLDKVRV
jgi:hypothetical protein